MTFAWVLAGLLVALAVAAVVATRLPAVERPVRVGVLAAEALVVLYAVADLGRVLGADPDDRPDSLLTHVGYAVAAVGLIPVLVLRPAPADAGTRAAAATEAAQPAETTGTTEPGDEEEAAVEPASLWVVSIALVAVAVCVLRLAATR